jgi:hypothetical protein
MMSVEWGKQSTLTDKKMLGRTNPRIVASALSVDAESQASARPFPSIGYHCRWAANLVILLLGHGFTWLLLRCQFLDPHSTFPLTLVAGGWWLCWCWLPSMFFAALDAALHRRQLPVWLAACKLHTAKGLQPTTSLRFWDMGGMFMIRVAIVTNVIAVVDPII